MNNYENDEKLSLIFFLFFFGFHSKWEVNNDQGPSTCSDTNRTTPIKKQIVLLPFLCRWWLTIPAYSCCLPLASSSTQKFFTMFQSSRFFPSYILIKCTTLPNTFAQHIRYDSERFVLWLFLFLSINLMHICIHQSDFEAFLCTHTHTHARMHAHPHKKTNYTHDRHVALCCPQERQK